MTAPTTAASPPREPDATAYRLVAHLNSLVPTETHRGDRAALAALRNSLGKKPGVDAECWRILGDCLPDDWDDRHLDAFSLGAGLFALHPVHRKGDERLRERGLGASLRAIRFREGTMDDDEGLARRFVALLDARREAIPDHLRHLVKLLHSKKPRPAPPDYAGAVDYGRLILDILDWDHPDRLVQRRWAAGFWARQAGESTASEPDATIAPTNDDDTDTTRDQED